MFYGPQMTLATEFPANPFSFFNSLSTRNHKENSKKKNKNKIMAIGSRPFGDPSGTETIVFRVAFCFAFEKKNERQVLAATLNVADAINLRSRGKTK